MILFVTIHCILSCFLEYYTSGFKRSSDGGFILIYVRRGVEFYLKSWCFEKKLLFHIIVLLLILRGVRHKNTLIFIVAYRRFTLYDGIFYAFLNIFASGTASLIRSSLDI